MTPQDLAEEVLLELGRADGADPAENTDDIAFVKRRYDALFLAGEDREWVFWEKDSIPDRVFVPLAKYLAFECRGAFGRPDYDPRDDTGISPSQRLKALGARESDGYPVRVEYF